MNLSIKTSNLFLFLLIITVIDVIIKTLGIANVSVHVNKVDYAIILVSFSVIFFTLKSQTKRPIKIITALFLIYTLISLLSSYRSIDSMALGQAILNSKFYIVLLFCYYSNINSGIIPKIEKTLFIVLILNVFFILLGRFFPALYASIFPGAIVDSIIQGTTIKRYSGIFYHPGPMGVFVSLCLLWSVAMWWTHNRRSILTYMSLLSIISLILSGQRMEFAACIVVLLCGYLIKISKSTFTITFIGFILLVAFMFVANNQYIFETVLNIDRQHLENINARYVLYLGGLELAYQNFPLGNGLATFGSSMSITNPDAAYFSLGIERLWWFEGDSYLTDTFWAMVIGESGLLGTLVYLLLILYLILVSFKQLKTNQNTFSFIPLYAFLSTIFTFIISIATPFYTGAALPLLIVGIANALTLRTYEKLTRI
jgi:hypothetical protein